MSVSRQYEQISPDEYVLRRVLNKKDFIDIGLDIPVQRAAVGPTALDIDGLSVYRETLVTPKQVAESGNNPAGYYVVRFKVQDLLDLDLGVVPDPIKGELLGHSLIPKLSITAKQADKKLYKERTLALVKLVRVDDIVFVPDK